MAKEAKKGFVLYYDYAEQLELLTDEQRGLLLMALLQYGATGAAPELDGMAKMAFAFIAKQMDRDSAAYEETCRKRSQAGKRGGRPPKGTEAEANADSAKQPEAKKTNAFPEKQTEAKKPDTDTNKETDTDTETNKDTKVFPNGNTDISPDGDITPPDGGVSPGPAAESTPYVAIVALYHELCPSYPRLRNVGTSRKKAIAARWKEYGHDLDTFRELFEMAEASPFLKGQNRKNWTADFNWLMNSENMAKVLEGNYSDDTKGGQANAEHSRPAEPARREQAGSEATLSGFRMAGT